MDRSCENVEWLAAYLDRTLSDTERRSCEEHLAKCPRCRAELVAIDAELHEMGLNRPAREAIARRAASAQSGERTPAMTRFTRRIREFMLPRGRTAVMAGAVASLAVIVVVGALLLPRLVPSLDPDMRRGAAKLSAILATADIGDLRLAGQTKPFAEGSPSFRGAGASERKAFDEAEESLQKALVRHPDNERAYRMLGDLYLAGGEAERAGNVYQRALLAKPDAPAILNNLAVAQFRAGDVEASRRTLKRAFALVDAPPEICYNLAVVWREAGNREEMKHFLELYLTKDGTSPWAVKARRMLTK